MKILKLKSILFSLMAIAMVTVFLSSCEKDYAITEADYDNPSYINEIKAQGINDSKDFQFIFEIASNNEKLAYSFKNESITMEFLNQKAIDEINQKESDSENNTGPQNPDQENEETSNGNDFVRITLKEIVAPHSLSEMPPYELNINPKVNEIIKEMKAITVLDFEQSVPVTNINQPNSRVDFYNKNKRIHLKGDCGKAWTKTRNYWAYTGSDNKYDLIPDGEDDNITWFKCNRYIAVCCLNSNSNKWVRRVTVLRDVLAGYTELSNSCDGFSYCALNADNSFSGYYPNGCNN